MCQQKSYVTVLLLDMFVYRIFWYKKTDAWWGCVNSLMDLNSANPCWKSIMYKMSPHGLNILWSFDGAIFKEQ